MEPENPWEALLELAGVVVAAALFLETIRLAIAHMILLGWTPW